ncbi:CR1-alpha [Simian adenovirus 19]|uniref:CR1-alpha n=1 Tax=Simian adenovirus 19 TaxID=38416 RepID=A0A0M4NHN2_9ADEN|nr:CR1-alpha [Simian adenovirus 19]ALE30442.1 CR1-alpha [Simian adenovirus 19]
MKIYAVFCVLSLINNICISKSAHVVRSSTESSIKGIRQTLFFYHSTPLITLNCNCTNEIIQWLVNGKLCKVFFSDGSQFNRNNSFCNNCSKHFLTLYPPFPSARFSCVGTGHGTSCYYNWFLREAKQKPSSFLQQVKPSSVPRNSIKTAAYSTPSFNPLFSVLAIILLVSFNLVLLTSCPVSLT